MSGITLTSAVRQNLLSLQSTAELLSSTQSRLATGKKVNSALDNPTNFFTAAGLDARASDINNLLDGIGNGVQILQSANTGITSLQKLVDTAKSIANQALQTTAGYTKSSFSSSVIEGATASNLLGTSEATPVAGAAITAGAFSTVDVSAAGSNLVPATTATAYASAAAVAATTDLSGTNAISFTLNVDGTTKEIELNAAAIVAFNADVANTDITDGSAVSREDIAKLINFQFGADVATISNTTNLMTITSAAAAGPGSIINISNVTAAGTGSASAIGIAAYAEAGSAGQAAVPAASLTYSLTVDGGTAETVTISAAAVQTYNTANPTATLDASKLTAANVAALINSQVDDATASVKDGALVFTSKTTGKDTTIALTAGTSAGTVTGSTGMAAATGVGADAAEAALDGRTLTIAATAGGTATTITFGKGEGQIKTLDQLNTALASNNMMASISKAGVLSITTTNDNASANIGALGGTAFSDAGGSFVAAEISGAIGDAVSLNTRANLVSQYNKVIEQIVTTAQDASFNGVNLLNGDQLKLVFNETGKSTLSITGVNFGPEGLGIAKLTAGTDFVDNAATNKILDSLNTASTTLRSQASAFGSNLSVVQIRQDFSKNLINVLQTGAANLTLADTNEEAANSQALSTRQSIAVSALSLANQSQQGVLQLLR